MRNYEKDIQSNRECIPPVGGMYQNKVVHQEWRTGDVIV